jgi:dihydrofolate reductase
MTDAPTVPLVVVAAVARNGVIGGDNRLLWRLRSDMRRFRSLTMGKPLIMGRRTFDSIGKPLPGRETIVVTRQHAELPEGVHRVAKLQDAVQLAQVRARALAADAVMVVGGGEIYRALIDSCDRLEITEVELEPEGDTTFPDIDPSIWREVHREAHSAGEGDEVAFTFVAYERRSDADVVENRSAHA